MKRQLIIVAAGEGKRMQEKIPKQFIEIEGKPVLMWTLLLFENCKIDFPVILVLSEKNFTVWEHLCKKHKFTLPHKIIRGGNTRFESVYNGLSEVKDDCLVAIHDGVRPFASINVIENVFKEAEKYGNAVPSIKIKDSLRQITGETNTSISRENIRQIQTPQIFKSEILLKSYRENKNNNLTDDASIVEKTGYKINLVEGNEENIKITTQSDLIMASALIKYFPY